MKILQTILLLTLLVPTVACASSPAAKSDWEKIKSEKLKPVTEPEKEAIRKAVPDAPTAKPKKAHRILVFYRCEGFVHGSIPSANYCIQQMGEKTGAFTADLADTYDVFTPDNLKKYDGIILNNTTHMEFETPSQLNAFLDFITGGKGLTGIHAASDNFGRYPEARAIVGGEFGGHPWTAGGTWAFKLDDPDHKLNAAFDGKGFWHQDEIYQYDPKSYAGPDKLRILVSLDMSKKAVSSRIKDGPREVPVSWLRTAGKGRVFYTNFGHRNETFADPAIVRHILDGIQYSLGDLEADATPTDQIEKRKPALAPAKL